MATHADLRKIAMAFPGAIDGAKHGARLGYSVVVKGKDKHGAAPSVARAVVSLPR